MDRADWQGLQFSPVYKVTGYLLATCRSSNGSALAGAPPPLAADLPGAVFELLSTGGLSEKDTLPSGPTIRYTGWAKAAAAQVIRAQVAMKLDIFEIFDIVFSPECRQI
jgi:hypothetical protein